MLRPGMRTAGEGGREAGGGNARLCQWVIIPQARFLRRHIERETKNFDRIIHYRQTYVGEKCWKTLRGSETRSTIGSAKRPKTEISIRETTTSISETKQKFYECLQKFVDLSHWE
jgi:hypothetical protein